MDSLVILLITGVAMSLFSALLMAVYSFLEDDYKKKEIRRYARRQIIKEMEKEKQMQEKMNESMDMHQEYR
jgi:hypothetical protein